MNSLDQLKMKLAAILSTECFGLKDIERLLKLKELIIEQNKFDFSVMITENLKIELADLIEYEDAEHSMLLATVLGYSAIIEWLKGEPQLMLKLIVENPTTRASRVAMSILDLCFEVAEDISKAESTSASSAATAARHGLSVCTTES